METPAIDVVHCQGLEAASAAIIPVVHWQLREAIDKHGYATMALSGGKTPAGLFEALARSGESRDFPWHKVWFFFVDERAVAPGHPDSNYGMFHRHLAEHLPIIADHIFRMPVETIPLSAAAAHYQRTLRDVFIALSGRDMSAADDQYPAIDLVLLGMGSDGHTASLFPRHPALQRGEWVVAVDSEQAVPPVPRLTLTLPVINHADTVLFLIAGEAKIRLAETFLQGPPLLDYPASFVRPQRRLLWYMAR